MKPIQQHKDPRITNISFDNFTGSICIITPVSDDEETQDLMLSSPQTNGGADLFKPNHHLALLTQPVLGARSRKKDKTDSINNSRRSSFNDSPALILSTNRVEKIPHEKRNHHQESSDSGLDFSLSTNSSVQYPFYHTVAHRPLSALNEDSNVADSFHEQPSRFPVVHFGHHRSTDDTKDQHHLTSISNEQERSIKKSNDPSSIQQYHSLNGINSPNLSPIHPLIRKAKKPSRKKSKLNIIVDPSVSFSSSRLTVHDDQAHSITRITSSSTNQTTTTIRNPQIKPKAITPLGNYPSQEQIRAHINRSVIERQHPSYLSHPTRTDVTQHPIPFEASSSKSNHLLSRQPKQANGIYHSNPNVQGGHSTIQNFHIAPSRQRKQTLPTLYNAEMIDDRQEKRNSKEKKRTNDMNKWQEHSPKEQVRLKGTSRQDQTENVLTSTPCRHDEQHRFQHNQSTSKILKEQNLTRQSQRLKPPEFVVQNKNRTMDPSPSNTAIPFQSRPKKLTRIPHNPKQTDPNHSSNSRSKSPSESINSLLRTTRIQPMNMNHLRRENESNQLTKTNLSQFNTTQKNSNRFFPRRSPTSWSVLSDHQSAQQQYNHYQTSSSSSSPQNQFNDKTSSDADRLILLDEEQLLDGRHVIPTNYLQFPSVMDRASQTSSRHTHPFTCTADNSPRDLMVPQNTEIFVEHRSCSPSEKFPFPLGKVTLSTAQDDVSTNYDSDDGWSDGSAELLYVDERYSRQKKTKKKKKKNISSSSHRVLQQQNVLLQ